MSERGVFAVDRSIFTDEWGKEPYSRREAWLWLIAEAAWRPRKVKVGAIWVTLDRGQLCHSVRFMADAWGWTKSRVDRFLGTLAKRESIRLETGTGQNVVTICNYCTYQRVSLPERDSSGTAAGQERDKREDREPIENNTHTLPAETHGNPRPIPFDPAWELDAIFTDAAVAEGLPAHRIETEWKNFRDWQLAHGNHLEGDNRGSFDWIASWRRWCRNPMRLHRDSPKMPAGGGGRASQTGSTGQAARIEELMMMAQAQEGLTGDATHDEFSPAPGGHIADRTTAAFDPAGRDRDRQVPFVSGGGRGPSDALLRAAAGGGHRSRESSNLRHQRLRGPRA